MNNTEMRMLELLKVGREKYGILAVKAEFEAEGTRTDEFLRLIEIARRAGVDVALKIGGCEAVRDLIEARQYGVDYIIAPMVESPYALKKYIEAKNKVFSAEEQSGMRFLFNLETRSTFDHLEAMSALAGQNDVGFVLGRVDFAGSMDKTRDFVNSEEMTGYAVAVGEAARKAGVELVVGGGVSPDSIEPLRRVRSSRLDRFETRKVVFDASVLDGDQAKAGMELAIEFELLWLKNKRDFYRAIAEEDQTRIAMMEARQQSIPTAAAAAA